MRAIRWFSLTMLLSAVVLMIAADARAKPKQPDTPPRTSPTFSALDKNQDGKISLEEFKAGFPGLANAEEKFKSLDKNGDGFLSMDEYKAGYPDPIPPKKPGKNGGKQAQPKVDPAKLFAKLDTNHDGKLSLDEFKAWNRKDSHAEKKFKSADKDGDGFLSLDEFKKMLAAKPAPKKAKNQ